MKKLGILGGTFNPVHLGHRQIADYFATAIPLDEVLIIPAGAPPHKDYIGSVSDIHRMEMCKIAFNSPLYHISDIELKRSGKSYTVDTLRELRRERPEDKLYFIMGADMFLSFKQWKEFEAILELAAICAAPREGQAAECLHSYAQAPELAGGQFYIAEQSFAQISSTQVRNLLASGGDVSSLIDMQVLEYIKLNKLYEV
ncbi:MAG: nicotinate-nucleotide adenylyltransferase [Oscillospiraceae bacterium]|jgi:nicotinate-nucleotide adenylyltransferase|nr:nicotinate-nucleotide adenylyltransferase [Oscillospiraceae bacterium]